ncbi:MmcB family DNA repair protein [Limimaricola sp.]|uniref:MmcB family DNA repair protein n=1 Tax=Limimaricola sp. TaxID=2211665 RepID=UPI0040589E68
MPDDWDEWEKGTGRAAALPEDALSAEALARPRAEPLPGQILARGVCRHLLGHGFVSVEEFVPAPGLRVDVMAMGPKGEIWVIECKSSRADFTSDRKWQGYLEYCDRYFWAVDDAFPLELLPEETGIIIADGYDAEIVTMAPETRLAGARRKSMLQKFARHAALRWHKARDPAISLSS